MEFMYVGMIAQQTKKNIRKKLIADCPCNTWSAHYISMSTVEGIAYNIWGV